MFEYDESARKAVEILDTYDLSSTLNDAYHEMVKDPWDIKVEYIPSRYPELEDVLSDLCEDEFMEYLSSRYPVKFDEVISYRMYFCKKEGCT